MYKQKYNIIPKGDIEMCKPPAAASYTLPRIELTWYDRSDENNSYECGKPKARMLAEGSDSDSGGSSSIS